MLAAHKRRVAVDPAFNLIDGEHSTKVADLVVGNPAYDGVAGVTVPLSSSETWRGSSCELSISESRASSSKAAFTAFRCAR